LSQRSEVVYKNGAPSTPGYLLALLRELLHVPRGLTEIAEAKQVRKLNQNGILYQFKKRVRKSILTFRTKFFVDFFFEGFRSTLKFFFLKLQIRSWTRKCEDKESQRCRAPIICFTAALRGRDSPPNGLQLGKRTPGMFGPRLVGEGMGRGNGESITANAMSNRPTNVTKTNQCPAFVAYRRKEVCMHPQAEKRVCTRTEQPIRTHMSACTSDSKRCFVREH